MPINGTATINPFSTATTYGPATRDYGDANSYVFKSLAAGGVCTLPRIENFPAVFMVAGSGTSAQPAGIVAVTAAGQLVVTGATANLATAAASNVLVPAVASGVLTLTANATTWTSRDIVITRIG